MNESVLDLALRHTVGLRFRLGLFVSLSRVDCLLAQQDFERPLVCCAAQSVCKPKPPQRDPSDS